MESTHRSEDEPSPPPEEQDQAPAKPPREREEPPPTPPRWKTITDPPRV